MVPRHLSQKLKKEALDGISSLRYKKGKINTLPDGKLKECGAWSASDDTALSVTMENPDSLYLRGFVGSVYDGSSWKSLDTRMPINRGRSFTGSIRMDFMGRPS